MVKLFSKKLMPIFLIIVVTIGVVLIYKNIKGTKIEHYKQYILPIQGQKLALKDINVDLHFYVLDEEEISEMASKENINAIRLIDTKGNSIAAKEWKISFKPGFYSGSEYSDKQLSIVFNFKQSVDITGLEIDYVDKTEYFDIGKLHIEVLEMNSFSTFTQIWADIGDMSIREPFPNKSYYGHNPTILVLSSNVLHDNGMKIISIDLGVPGLGVDPETLKTIEAGMDWGIAFTNDPDNQIYLEPKIVEELLKPTLQIDIGSNIEHFIMALNKLPTYNNQLIVTYFNPMFTCLDIKTGKEYIFGDIGGNSRIYPPYIIKDDFVKKILEEYGV